MVYEQKGLYENAAREWQTTVTLSGVPADRAAQVMEVFRREGYAGLVRRQIQIWEGLAGEGPVISSNIALRYTWLGEKEAALRWLERSFASHTRDLVYLKVEPGYDMLRSDPRFQEMVRRVRLAD